MSETSEAWSNFREAEILKKYDDFDFVTSIFGFSGEISGTLGSFSVRSVALNSLELRAKGNPFLIFRYLKNTDIHPD